MEEFKRFSVQILGTVDAKDAVELHQAINTALGGVDRFKVKAVSLDEWTDGLGETRLFDESGDEIFDESEQPEQPIPEPEPTDDQEIQVIVE